MASIKACDDVLLLSCGEKVAVYDFRRPGPGTVLEIPQIEEAKDDDDDDDKNPPKPRSHNDQAPQPNRVLASDVSRDGQYIALCDDRKFLHVFHNEQRPLGDGGEVQRLTLTSSRCVPRRCTVIRFTADLESILVGDKSGDVFSFPLHPPSAISSSSSSSTPAPSQAMDGQSEDKKMDADERGDGGGSGSGSHDENDKKDTNGDGGGGCDGQLVLGHLSMLLDMVLLEGDRYVVTSDRDEKIRISNYPDAYNIHTYCLGHTAFVISLACDHSNKILFSGSGDASICAWTYEGNLVHQRHCLEDFPQLEDAATEEPSSENTTDEKTPTPTSTTSTTPPEDESRQAVQQISYCSDCCLLFVAVYKCPHILVYRLTPSTNTSQPSLQPVQLLTSGHAVGDVVSLHVHKCVLWVVRQAGESKLHLEAVRICVQGEKVVSTPIAPDSDTPESRILQSASTHPDLLTVAQSWQDPVPTLWKSQIDGYVQDYLERKRQRIEGSAPDKKSNEGKKWKSRKSKADASQEKS